MEIHPSADLMRLTGSARRRSRSLEVGCRIDRRGILSHFEMELRSVGRAAHSGNRDLLAALHGVAARYLQFAGMPVNGDETVLVPHQHGVAEILQAVAGVDDDAVLGRLNGRSLRDGYVDSVIRLAPACAESGNHPAAHWPAHAADAGCVRR